MKKIIFVCLGNICRSPLAQAMMRKIVQENKATERYFIDSAGTGSWHIGKRSDTRMIKIGEKNHLVMDHLGQQIESYYGDAFDFIFAMDRDNQRNILQIIDEKHHHKVFLFRHFDTVGDSLDVPDPYYDELSGFENVYTIVKRNCEIIFSLLEKNAVKK